MPRKLMRKLIPHPAGLKNSWFGGLLGKLVEDPYLFHLNRRSVSLGVMVGLWWAFTPIPTQMVPAAITAWIVRANLPISVALVWISNPITIPPIMLMCYALGASILDVPIMPPESGVTIEWVRGQLSEVFKPLMLGCLIISTASALLGYAVMRLWWSLQVRQNWSKRQANRAARRPK